LEKKVELIYTIEISLSEGSTLFTPVTLFFYVYQFSFLEI